MVILSTRDINMTVIYACLKYDAGIDWVTGVNNITVWLTYFFRVTVLNIR